MDDDRLNRLACRAPRRAGPRSWTSAGTCPRPVGTAGRNFCSRISRRALPRHRRRSRTRRTRSPHAAERRATSAAMRTGSAARIASSSMTIQPNTNAARGWFMFRHFGVAKVAILDGGFQKWLAEGRPRKARAPPARRRSMPRSRPGSWPSRRSLAGLTHPLIDARGQPRFRRGGRPAAGVAAGISPERATCLFRALYIARTGPSSRVEEIRQLFDDAGADPAEPFIATCGSGVTANSLIFAAARSGTAHAALRRKLERMGRRSATPEGQGPA